MKDKTICSHCKTQVNSNDCIHGYIDNKDLISISTQEICNIFNCEFCHEIGMYNLFILQ